MTALTFDEHRLTDLDDLDKDEEPMVKTNTGSTNAGDADDVDASDDEDDSEYELDLTDIRPPPGLSKPLSDVPSVGSRLHAAGLCKPCAWFWKSQGCSNGHECEHCHLCPKGEVRRRKKDKKQLTKNLPAPERKAPVQLPNLLGAQLPAPAVLKKQELVIQRQQQQLHMMQLQLMQQQQHLQLLAGASMLAQAPTAGSALHGTGTCKPCAWHWKPGGCQAGPACSFCHLCPPGEIKLRKKIKVALMGHS